MKAKKKATKKSKAGKAGKARKAGKAARPKPKKKTAKKTAKRPARRAAPRAPKKQSTMSPVVHFEMPYEDQGRVATFYKGVFGWEVRIMGEEMGHYVVVTTADVDVKPDAPRGAIGGGFFRKSPEMPGQHPSVVIAVGDIRLAIDKINGAGGSVQGEPMHIPGIGQYVSFVDPEGNRASILQPER